MLGGYKAIGDLNEIGWSTSDVGLCLEVETGSWQDVAGSTIDHDEVTKHTLRFDDAIGICRCRLAQIACNYDDYLHQKEVE